MKIKKYFIITLLFAIASLGTYVFIFLEGVFSKIEELKQKQIKVVLTDNPDKPEIIIVKHNPDYASINDISKYAVGAVVVSEDWAFPNHHGIDTDQLFNALEKSWKKKKLVRGASTITQQLAKNLFLDRKKSIFRKIMEVPITLKLENSLGKKKILELYFNIVEWGPNIYGIKAASKHYFGKNPSQINVREASFLAFLLPSPKKYYVSFKRKSFTKFAHKITTSIYYKMNQASLISNEELDNAIASGPFFSVDQTSKDVTNLEDYEDNELDQDNNMSTESSDSVD